MLTKQVVALVRNSTDEEMEETNSVDFFHPGDEEGVYDSTSVNLFLGDWEDMGKPNYITVTIEPFDILNEDS